jgi:conjugal transfer pilin signal peptidase TrbI
MAGAWQDGGGWRGKLAAVLLAGAAAFVGAGVAADRYQIAFDVQKHYTCLPFDLFLVDRQVPSALQRGALVQFAAPPAAQRLTGAFTVVKVIAGIAGDTWRIANDELYVNGELWGRLYLLNTLGLAPGALDGGGTVPAGSVFVLGTTPSSYDSRYWGPLPVRNVRGVAHVLL